MEAHEFNLEPGSLLPRDCGYVLLSALSKQHPFLHGRADIQIAPVRGTRLYDNHAMMRTDSKSILHIRGLTEEDARKLERTWCRVGTSLVALGEMRTRTLTPSSYLSARSVVFANKLSPMEVLTEVARRIASPNIRVTVGRSQGLQMHGRHFTGFQIGLSDLDEATSLRVQAEEVGRFTSMGCGVFYPGTRESLRAA